MIIWKGDGIAVIAYVGVGAGLGFLVGGELGLWVGVLLGSLLTWSIGWLTNVRNLDPEDQDQHELYAVPIQYWGIGGTLVGAYQVITVILS